MTLKEKTSEEKKTKTNAARKQDAMADVDAATQVDATTQFDATTQVDTIKPPETGTTVDIAARAVKVASEQLAAALAKRAAGERQTSPRTTKVDSFRRSIRNIAVMAFVAGAVAGGAMAIMWQCGPQTDRLAMASLASLSTGSSSRSARLDASAATVSNVELAGAPTSTRGPAGGPGAMSSTGSRSTTAPSRQSSIPSPTPSSEPRRSRSTSSMTTRGAIVVRVKQTWAQVWIDGVARGTTPVRALVDAGTHKVLLVSEGHRERVTVIVAPDGEFLIERDW